MGAGGAQQRVLLLPPVPVDAGPQQLPRDMQPSIPFGGSAGIGQGVLGFLRFGRRVVSGPHLRQGRLGAGALRTQAFPPVAQRREPVADLGQPRGRGVGVGPSGFRAQCGFRQPVARGRHVLLVPGNVLRRVVALPCLFDDAAQRRIVLGSGGGAEGSKIGLGLLVQAGRCVRLGRMVSDASRQIGRRPCRRQRIRQPPRRSGRDGGCRVAPVGFAELLAHGFRCLNEIGQSTGHRDNPVFVGPPSRRGFRDAGPGAERGLGDVGGRIGGEAERHRGGGPFSGPIVQRGGSGSSGGVEVR